MESLSILACTFSLKLLKEHNALLQCRYAHEAMKLSSALLAVKDAQVGREILLYSRSSSYMSRQYPWICLGAGCIEKAGCLQPVMGGRLLFIWLGLKL